MGQADDVVAQSRQEERRSRKLLEFDLATHRRPYVTATALAAYLAVDRRTIVRMIAAHDLQGVKVGRCWRIPTTEARRMFHV